ncbi:alpha/beta hydrolase [Streptomyces sp. NPDC001380]|uniref:alpha/beta hydrolase n=1 Tax=Streptomyces sp. NPDC001380 TaxID=3364566 RepID=UPI0036757F42
MAGTTAAHRPLRTRLRPEEARGAVLVLHGGRDSSLDPVEPWNAAALRMRPFVRGIRRAVAGAGIAVGEVRYRYRGWNGDRADPLRDTLDALEELEELLGPVPVVLVGHSMGGRAALRAGGHPRVAAVVGLAPWCPPGEPAEQLAGRDVVLLHSDRDRITDPAGSRAFAERARRAGARACRLVVAGSDHAMLRRAGDWHAVTAATAAGLAGAGPLPPAVAAALRAAALDEPLAPVR